MRILASIISYHVLFISKEKSYREIINTVILNNTVNSFIDYYRKRFLSVLKIFRGASKKSSAVTLFYVFRNILRLVS